MFDFDYRMIIIIRLIEFDGGDEKEYLSTRLRVCDELANACEEWRVWCSCDSCCNN